ncbi:hypothetical protein NDI44_05220 [Trichocoleus sp. DQ-A3]
MPLSKQSTGRKPLFEEMLFQPIARGKNIIQALKYLLLFWDLKSLKPLPVGEC